MQKKSQIANSIAIFLSQLSGRIIRFIYLIIIVHILRPDDVGIFSYGIAFYLFITGFADFGQSTLLPIRIGRNRSNYQRIIQQSFTLSFSAIAVTSLAGLLFIAYYESDSGHFYALSAFILALCARAFCSWVRSVFVGLESTTWIPRYETIFRGLEALIGSAGLLLGAGLVFICYLHAFIWLAEAIASYLLLTREAKVFPRITMHIRSVSHVARVSMYYMLSIWLLLAFPQVGILSLRFFQPATSEIAYFAIAMQFFTAFLIVPASISAAILPGLSRAHKYRSMDDLGVIASTIKAGLVVGGVIAIVSNAVGPWLITTFMGENYRLAGASFARLCWGLGAYGIVFISIQALNALGHRVQAILASFLIVFIHVIGLILLLPLGGAVAAALSLVLASIAGTVYTSVVIGPLLGKRGQGWWFLPIFLTAVAALVTYLPVNIPTINYVLALLLLLFLTWRMRVFSLSELQYIIRRIKPQRPTA